MTPEKAIKFFDEEIVRLERAPIINGCEMTDDWRGHLKICKLAKSALEKQIPKKPKYEDVDNIYGAMQRICKACGDICMVSKDAKPYEHYCRYCGQALDWSDAE